VERRQGRAALNAAPRLSLSLQVAVNSAVPARSTLRRWALAALERDCKLTLRIVGTAEGRRLNAGFRGRDYATNVLTFVYGEQDSWLCGDIALCAPVIAREAREQGKAARAHWAHLVVHGLLHLQGWDHARARGARAMESLETDIVTRLGYPDPYRMAA
jgi:probable rRNA maturation factor